MRSRRGRERSCGALAYGILHRIGQGLPWQPVSREVYASQGSLGNGGAMRAAPLGAWFAGDPARAAREAVASAEVTHAHPEGQAGAVAVAAAFAHGARGRGSFARECREFVAAHTSEGTIRRGVLDAAGLAGAAPADAARALGDGTEVTAADTVPFARWCAARSPDDCERAIWRATSRPG